MNKSVLIIALALITVASNYAQNSINDYKYMVVPLQFDFFKGKDTFRTSTLTRYLFKNEGFEVFFDEEDLPEDLFKDRCLALYTSVNKISSMLKTKVQIEIKDCYGNRLFLSDVGETRTKAFKQAFPEAIRDAFKSFEQVNYMYNPNADIGSKSKVTNNSESAESKEISTEVEQLKKELRALKTKKAIVLNKTEESKEDKANVSNDKEREVVIDINTKNMLYAQPIENGFQVVDTTPTVVMVLLKTAVKNVYSVKGQDAIVFKEGETWMYSKGAEKKPLNIKF